MKNRLINLICLMVLVSSCNTSRRYDFPSLSGTDSTQPNGPMETSRAKPLTPEQARLLAVSTEYQLGGGDVVSLWAEDISGLNRTFVLGPDGKVTVPGVGVLSFKGLTRTEAMALLEERLKKFYRDPKVSLLIETYNNNRVSVLGEVQKPGEFSFTTSPSLLSVLAMAGGPTQEADLSTCTIVRGSNSVIRIDLNELLQEGNLNLNIPLLPNDSIYVRSKSAERIDVKGTFFVLGEVKNPGVFALGAKGQALMDPLRAISMAGGNTEDAELTKVRIVRRTGDGPPGVFKVDLENVLDGKEGGLPAVMSGDIVYVPKKGLATFR